MCAGDVGKKLAFAHSRLQKATELVELNLDDWPYWQADQAVYAEGSRDKSDHKAPDPCRCPFIKAGHCYLFKQSDPRYPAQFWGEIFAYRLGRLIGVAVPPAHVAVFDKIPGALIEWFYDAQHEATCILGGELLLAADSEYDRERGIKPGHCHNLEDVVAILQGQNPRNWRADFSDMLVLDTLIGNVDRHHNNWGLIKDGPADTQQRMTPAFDNGTSLAHERTEEKLAGLLASQDWVLRHATGKNARHHMRLQGNDTKGAKFIALLEVWFKKNRDMLPRLRQRLAFDLPKLNKILSDLKQFEISVPLTDNRAEMMRRIVSTRRELIAAMMERLDG